MDYFGTHLLLCLAIEQLTESSEAKNADASSSEAWLADPDVVRSVDRTVLWVHFFKFLVHLVGLIHNVDIRDLPAFEPE